MLQTNIGQELKENYILFDHLTRTFPPRCVILTRGAGWTRFCGISVDCMMYFADEPGDQPCYVRRLWFGSQPQRFLPTLQSTAKCFRIPLAQDTHDPLFTVKPGVEIQDPLIHRQIVVNLNIPGSARFLGSQLLLKVLGVQQPLVPKS